MTIILGQRLQSTGNSSPLYVTPPSFIITGSVPLPFIRAPPVALIKQHISLDVRYHVHIGSGDHNHCRRSSKPYGRQIDPDTYIYLCITLACRYCHGKQQSAKTQTARLFYISYHLSLLSLRVASYIGT
jgi:hypothetical protein